MAQRLAQLFVMDPLDRIDVRGDSTYMLMREATDRGWPVAMCTPQDIYVLGQTPRARVVPVETRHDAPWFVPGPAEDRALQDHDVVWMRKDPPFDMGYVFTTYLLDLVAPSTLVVNLPQSLRSLNEKLSTLRYPDLVAPSLITREIRRAMDWARAQDGRVVLKPWDGNGGRGVLISDAGDPNLRSMLEILTDEERRYVIVQRYLPEIAQGDKRIILVEGEARGWMLRVPQPGDHRGNMHAGAKVRACDLTEADRRICAAIGPALRDAGLVFVGIDVIGDRLTEINVTSPTGIQEINRLMGTRLEVEITDAVAARAARGGRA